MKRFTTLALVALLIGQVARAEDDITKKTVTIPFKILKTGHMTVDVKVNGKGPYTLIFDTGAPITLLNNKVAKAADLLKGITPPLFSFMGTQGEVKIKELDVGGLKVADSTAIVMDHPTVKAISDAFGPIEGIVGFPFFARFRLTLNYKAKTMTLTPSGFKPPNVLAAMQTALVGSLLSSSGPQIQTTTAKWGMSVTKKSGDDEAGVTISKVLPGGVAARAGLKVGDRLLTLDDRWTDTVADTFIAAGYVKPGQTVTVKIKRGEKEMTLQARPTAGF